MRKCLFLFLVSIALMFAAVGAAAQSVTGSLSGVVADERGAVIAGASVTARNADTGLTRNATTDSEGRFRFVNMPVGGYEVTVEAPNFSKLVQSGITLVLNQDAVVDLTLKPGAVTETVNVTENASVLNTTTAEVATRFDSKRLSELPIAPNRNVFNVLLSTPGVSQLSAGQTGFANGLSFSSNGGRLRSNNFMLDGQDINDPSVSGGQVALNNPDAIGEVRIITNQFLAEYGRNSGSVVNFIGKSGTNDFHGTGFMFYNGEELNACSNTDRIAGFCNPASTIPNRRIAPFRKEFQYGFTLGGPFLSFGEGVPAFARDKTFFFGDYQRWTDRQLASGSAISGAPTAAGRAVLQNVVGNRPQVQALLNYLPAGTPNGQSTSFTVGGVTHTVPLGTFSGTSAFTFNSTQSSFRLDHRFSDRNLLYGRYRYDRNSSAGAGQVSPPGLTQVVPTRSQAATIVLNSILTSRLSNEARVSWSRFGSTTTASDPSSLLIPSLEVSALGLTGFNAGATRTALGLAVNLPQFRFNDTYQIQDSMVYVTGNHSIKFGVDLRRTDARVFFVPTIRGRLAYGTPTVASGIPPLQFFIDDIAEVATVNSPLRGGDVINFYRWKEYYFFVQDEWKIRNNFTLTYGLRYEYPGDSFSYLKELNQRVLAANGNNQGFALDPVPQPDKNNFMPRIGFNWNPRFDNDGIVGFLTGGDKLVLRGGYSRNYDANYINLNLNVASSFPFTVSTTFAGPQLTNAFVNLQAVVANPNPVVTNPLLQTRTVVGGDFRAPSTDQFSFEVQRELTADTVFKAGYIHTRGRGLFQTIDGNPRTACATGTSATPCPRVDPTRGVIRLRANRASSDYNALQLSLDKRLSRNFSANVNYTFSRFIDTASETFNPSNAEVAVAQDSFNLEAERARSSFDRPHRMSGSVVYELPFFREQQGFVGRALGGFQVNSFFTLQSGAPFTVLNGSDPAGAIAGIDGLVGNSIRPNLVGSPNFNGMTPREIRAACGTPVGGNQCPNFFSFITAAQRVGNAGRNILRADKLFLVDFGIIKNTRVTENIRFQVRADMFNVLNRRNYGVPLDGRLNNPNFLLDGAVAAGNRRIILGARLVF
ncbi:MAG TPA: carboxypeptidase regulatory-like domain-containing protein [Pyrinomonadaceae bacterium]|nr:carboxypeptidase regulatory-like domain-containing protein [Pyrinomonadaceae bacterium]